MDHLIDVSSHNSVYDWAAVRREGINGVSIKATQAAGYVNPFMAKQLVGATYAGLVPGPYHFGDPRDPARDQAAHFKNTALRVGFFQPGQFAPMYDAEDWPDGGLYWNDRDVLNAHIAEHIRVVRDLTGVREHLVYGSLSWWQSGALDPDVWADEDVHLWVAVYNERPGDLEGWNHPQAAVHQYTPLGNVPGITGNVDMNVTVNGFSARDLTIGGHDMPLTQADADLVVKTLLDRVLVQPQYGGAADFPADIALILSRLGYNTQRTDAQIAAVLEATARLESRPIADLNEEVLAAALIARGYGPVDLTKIANAVKETLQATRVTIAVDESTR